jgi:hypothetical protein
LYGLKVCAQRAAAKGRARPLAGIKLTFVFAMGLIIVYGSLSVNFTLTLVNFVFKRAFALFSDLA